MDYGFGTFASVGQDGFNQPDFSAMNKGITPIFFVEPELDEMASGEQKRTVYREMERVHLRIAGDSFSVHAQPVDEYIKMRFPEQYAHWKRTHEGQQIVGTPLKMWPMATPVQIKELEAINVFSVEDLAHIADVHVNRIPDGRSWRDKAVAWLRTASDTAIASKYAEENEKLRERIEALEQAHSKPVNPDHDTEHSEKSKARSEMMRANWAKRKAAAVQL